MVSGHVHYVLAESTLDHNHKLVLLHSRTNIQETYFIILKDPDEFQNPEPGFQTSATNFQCTLFNEVEISRTWPKTTFLLEYYLLICFLIHLSFVDLWAKFVRLLHQSLYKGKDSFKLEMQFLRVLIQQKPTKYLRLTCRVIWHSSQSTICIIKSCKKTKLVPCSNGYIMACTKAVLWILEVGCLIQWDLFYDHKNSKHSFIITYLWSIQGRSCPGIRISNYYAVEPQMIYIYIYFLQMELSYKSLI